MSWPKSTFSGRVEVECWGAGAKGSRNARDGVGMTGRGDAKSGEAGRRSGEGGAGL